MKNITLKLAWANLTHRPINSMLVISTLAAAIALFSMLLQAGGYAEQRVQKDLAGVDLVVGAKGSPIQLILSSLLHLDVPTGNIPLKEAQSLMLDPQVKRAVPLALGDNFRGFRIVGTISNFLDLYQAELSTGMLWRGPQEVVIGAAVNRSLDMQVGQSFYGAHGLSQSEKSLTQHDHAPYKVTGVLAPTGSVLDRLILTPIESVWEAHGQTSHEEHAHSESHDHDEHNDHELDDISELSPEGKEVTALLIQYASPIAALRLPRMINAQAGFQAAAPALEVTRLFSLSSNFTSAGKAIAALLILIGGLSIFVAVSSAVASKQYDIALIRAMGARPSFIFLQQLVEGMLIATVSALVGIFFAHFALFSAYQVYEP
ncbi:MAG: ABC transporter permease, partial [Kordiimonas sp.]